MSERVELGWRVKDRVTGLVGIAVCRTDWLNGCVRVGVQPEELKDGKPVESTYIDEPQLDIVDRMTIHTPSSNEPPKKVVGGPRADEHRDNSPR